MIMDVTDKPSEAALSHKELKALAKARRPWFMKKRFWLLGVAGAAVILGMATSGGDEADKPTVGGSTAAAAGSADEAAQPETLFPGRIDAQREDQERNIGGSAELSGYTATVTSAGFQQSVSDFETDGYVVVDVNIFNRDDSAQPYNTFDWKLQTPGGQVIEPTFSSVDQLGSGDLVHGGSVTGKIVFEVGSETGDFYVIYKPDAFDAARGIWKVAV